MTHNKASKAIGRSLVGTALIVVANAAVSTTATAEALQKYQRTSGVNGNLNSIGSDTLNNLMTFWSEGFRKEYPNVKVQVEGKGSSTAPPALIEGTAQLGPMSRAMKAKEIDAFEKKYGYKPTRFAVAVDSLAVYVNKSNPLKCLSLQEVDCIFSKTRKGGSKKDIKTWGQAGLKGKWASSPISLYGRNSASGTYGYFKKKALFKGDFKDTVKEQPGSASVVNGIAGDRNGVGYSGIGYKTSGVRVVPLSKKQGGPCYDASFANALAGKYPLGRSLYVYVAKAPNKPLPTLTREFLKFVLSEEGQTIVEKDGYGRLPAHAVKKQLGTLTNTSH